jgi:UDPglucose 6-dehydrogenase
VFRDLSAPKFEWDRPHGWSKSETHITENVQVVADPYACAEGSHAICVLTEWDEFKVGHRLYISFVSGAICTTQCA